MRCHSGGLVIVDDASPQTMAHVGRNAVHLLLGRVERQRERLLLRHPERQVERRLKSRCSTAPLLAADGVTVSLSEECSGLKRCVCVALYLAQRYRRGGAGARGRGGVGARGLLARIALYAGGMG